MKSSTITQGVAMFVLAFFLSFISNSAFATDGTGVVTVTANGGSCLGFTAAAGNGPDNWEVAEGGSYTMTINGVTECDGDAITVFVQATTGNFCFNATGGAGTYSGDFTVPNPACFTMPISYKCGADQPCDNSNTYNANGPSGTGQVHLRSAIFDGSCNNTGEDTVCAAACVCLPPSNIIVTDIGNDQVQVCWDAQECATGYILQYQWRGHQDWITIEVTAPDSCAIIDLLGHVFISVRVATICQDGSVTDYSDVVVHQFGGPCFAPSDQSTTDITSTSATLNWTPGTTTGNQRLRYSVANSNQTQIVGLSSSADTYILNGLLPSTTYKWRVRGDCWSPTQKFTTSPQKLNSSTESNGLNVYPNPASDRLFVTVTMEDADVREATVELVNALGQIIYSTNTSISNGSSIEVKLNSQITDGLYIVRVIANDKSWEQRILINSDK